MKIPFVQNWELQDKIVADDSANGHRGRNVHLLRVFPKSGVDEESLRGFKMNTRTVTAQNCSLFEIDAELEAAFDQLQEEREITGTISSRPCYPRGPSRCPGRR